MWVKTNSLAYANLNLVGTLYVTGSASDWHLNVWYPTADQDIQLNGTFTSESDALEAGRQLINGFDPADLV